MFNKFSVTRWHDLAVLPPDANAIRDIRAAVGTQALCASLAGINLSNWQRWEKGDAAPHPATWGLFLLAVGQHPRYGVSPK